MDTKELWLPSSLTLGEGKGGSLVPARGPAWLLEGISQPDLSSCSAGEVGDQACTRTDSVEYAYIFCSPFKLPHIRTLKVDLGAPLPSVRNESISSCRFSPFPSVSCLLEQGSQDPILQLCWHVEPYHPGGWRPFLGRVSDAVLIFFLSDLLRKG